MHEGVWEGAPKTGRTSPSAGFELVRGLFRLFRLAGMGGCNALRAQALLKYLSFRSPPPLPSIFLMDGHLTKIRGGKKGRLGRWSGSVFHFSGTGDNRKRQLQRSIYASSNPFLDSFRVADYSGVGPNCGLRFSGLPIASRKMALLSFACGEKNSVTSSSKKVSPVAPRCWAYAAR
jgi:hypothetical protein